MQGAGTNASANLDPHWSACVQVYVSPNKIQLQKRDSHYRHVTRANDYVHRQLSPLRGPNLMDNTVYRLFAYMVNRPTDIPTNGVSTYSWTDPSSKDSVISAVSNTDKAKRMAHLEQTNSTKGASLTIGRGNVRKVPRPDYFLKSESRCMEENQQKRNKNGKNAKKAK